MYTMEDLKTNRDAQITVRHHLLPVGLPLYFDLQQVTLTEALAGRCDYQVNGEISYTPRRTEPIGNDDPWSMTYNTDEVSDAEDPNIGLAHQQSYGEDETSRGVGCLLRSW